MFAKALPPILALLMGLLGTCLVWAADTATLDLPASVPAGAQIAVNWTGPGRQWDRIAIVPVGAPDGTSPDAPWSTYATGKKVSITAPDKPGQYEVRYLGKSPNALLARRPITVSPVTATVEGPRSALAGASIEVKWTGPANRYDRIYIVKAGAAEQATSDFSAPAEKSPARVTIPEALGEYEIRYLMGRAHTALAQAPLTITSVTASLDAPATVTAGSYYKVNWKGPGNEYDYIGTFPKGSEADQYVAAERIFKSPTQLRAPLAVGEYELRYQTGQTGTTLARAELHVTAAQQEPGLVRVNAGQGGVSSGGAVEVILDASGSMLQKIGAERRIDIAKRTLKNLTANVIPAGTPFALRVFGRKANSCQTDLDIPPRPLEPAALASKLDELSAMSNAKTPIAASLEKVASDLDGVHGERLVILVTDGEETCGGNPARTIDKLMKQGINVRINIVGFAVDDRKTAALFRQWSSAGGGGYFDAQNAASLDQALALAVKPRFEIIDAQKAVVAEGLVGGEPVSVLPGIYTVRLKGAPARSKSATVRPNATASVEL